MLDRPVQYLKGVGPRRSILLGKLGISTIRDLLGYFPREYDDRRRILKIGELTDGAHATVRGTVKAAKVVSLKRTLSVFTAAIDDGTGIAYLHFYRHVNRYHRRDVFAPLKETFQRGREVVANGIAEVQFGERRLNAEEYEVAIPGESDASLLNFMRIVPVYPLTEGIYQKWLRDLVRTAIEAGADEWPEIVPPEMREGPAAMPSGSAVRAIHFPEDFAQAEQARQKLAFDEFFLLETALAAARREKVKRRKAFRYEVKRSLLTPFREKLNFEFTPAQKKVINEIFSDLQMESPMNRLLMGDVGSGKTVVALSAMLLAVENGYQAALLAPTEILAEQHYLTVNTLLEGLPVTVGLLTGKSSGRRKDRAKILEAAREGKTDLLIGTHALLEDPVGFGKLSLAVIDEQHRFGVMQRARFAAKAHEPDILLMTATPIPRSLALTIYGDMEVSVIDRLPPGRRPVRTLHSTEIPAYDRVKAEIRTGHQAYIVYPLVEESDKVELKAAVTEAETLSSSVFRGYRVGLLHGQMTPAEKDRVMADFRAGKTQVLIATTVIEVGIDVPSATVMVIEHADRFGLATLHQLRGRIGRGGDQSYCILLGTPKTDEARRRIEAMVTTSDGFKIAAEDLALRGPGEFFGTAQHGMLTLKAGNLVTDVALIERAKERAREAIAQDPSLSSPAFAALRIELVRSYRERFGLLKIG